jgi:hypothetical protein
MVMAADVVVLLIMAVELELEDILGMAAMVLLAVLTGLRVLAAVAVAAQRMARLVVVATGTVAAAAV